MSDEVMFSVAGMVFVFFWLLAALVLLVPVYLLYLLLKMLVVKWTRVP